MFANGATSIVKESTATQTPPLWKLTKKIVRAFIAKVNCKTHRRGFKAYPKSFKGHKAVDVMYQILLRLKNDLGKVDREQAMNLLQCYLTKGVIKRATDDLSNGMFEDSDQLYRFACDDYDDDNTIRRILTLIGYARTPRYVSL